LAYHILANAVVAVHFGFILFVVLGGLLALRWKWCVFLHVPAFAWGALIEFAGWICPITPLEKIFRAKAGLSGYETGFIEHYLLSVIYPDGLTRGIQIGLGVLVLALNAGVYGFILWKRKKTFTTENTESV